MDAFVKTLIFSLNKSVILTALPGADTTKHENTEARSQEPE